MVRPDYIKCISQNDDSNTTWCGLSRQFKFLFVDIDHAVFNKKTEGRLVVCNDCWNAILKIMKENE